MDCGIDAYGFEKIFSYKVATETNVSCLIAGYIACVMRHLPSRPDRSVRFRAGLVAGWLSASLLGPGIALAGLGDDGSMVDRDVIELRAQRTVNQSSAYSVHELTLPGGTTVREYLTPAQKVFAVSWRGPSIPDLQLLLGTHFPRFQNAVRAMGRARRPVMVQESDLVIESGGHPRAFSGMAYLPRLMPPGFSADRIQ
jgi:hypothetical protein